MIRIKFRSSYRIGRWVVLKLIVNSALHQLQKFDRNKSNGSGQSVTGILKERREEQGIESEHNFSRLYNQNSSRCIIIAAIIIIFLWIIIIIIIILLTEFNRPVVFVNYLFKSTFPNLRRVFSSIFIYLGRSPPIFCSLEIVYKPICFLRATTKKKQVWKNHCDYASVGRNLLIKNYIVDQINRKNSTL